ncbi:MAG: recombination mediator RecR [Verrucomicrobiota bacterium]|jgi:recombination protein RecR|nr:recombination mediator RecR [Verrucomicrobiota bacterium]
MVPPVDNLIRALAKLPGLGKRSAERAALALLRRPDALSDVLVAALQEARASVCCCSVCGGFTALGQNPCRLCTDASRDDTVLCVVEEPSDIFAIERSGGFRGRYHALMGKLSPARQTGPAELRLRALAERAGRGDVAEVLLALSTDMEGDATAGYIGELLKPLGVRVTRLAFGLPADSGVGYSDPLTLKRAISGRIACD